MNFFNYIKYFDKSENKKIGQVRYTQLDLLCGDQNSKIPLRIDFGSFLWQGMLILLELKSPP